MQQATLNPTSSQDFCPDKKNSYTQACDDVLKAIEDLRSFLSEKQKSGSVPFQVAISLEENLDAIAQQARSLQRKG
jgi:hypothetical protein